MVKEASVTEKNDPAAEKPAQPQQTQRNISGGASSYSAIQDQASPILSSKRPRPHSSINPLAGNSLY